MPNRQSTSQNAQETHQLTLGDGCVMFPPRPHSRMLAVLTRSLALLLAVAAPALAQTPRITPAGDPTVRTDTIYRLAVNPADHPDDDYIYLLDDGVVRLEADGRGSRTYRQVVQILTREAAETWGEQSFSYVSGRERLTLNWVPVVRPTADLPKIEREPFAADSNGIDQYIDVAAPVQWADVARWYGGLSRDRYRMTPGLDSALGTVVTGARTLDDSLRALHRWVAQDFRYVSLSLGIGGFQPRLPAAVLATRYGDCKDKATLFIALARRLGLHADPVLLSSSGGIARDPPAAPAFGP